MASEMYMNDEQLEDAIRVLGEGIDLPAPMVINALRELQLLRGDDRPDIFQQLVRQAYLRAGAAVKKYPQPNYVLVKLGEEHGETVKEIVHYAEGRGHWGFVTNEMIDNLAMMIRLLLEGDQTINFTPPPEVVASMKESFCD
jgi:hypothetical protein